MKFPASCIPLLLIFNLFPTHAWKSWSPPDNARLLNILLESGSDPVVPPGLNYESFEEVHLVGPRVAELTVEMQRKLSGLWTFRATNGTVETFHVMKNFKKIIVQNCSTRTVAIDPGRSYEVEYFSVVFNRLQRVPENVNALKKVEKIFLHDNRIEYVEMADFSGLSNLKVLNLHDNKIFDIFATEKNPVVLPKLEKFFAFKNDLKDINFDHWRAVSLKEIWIHQNKLQIALQISNKFPTLKELTLDNNPFNCPWLESTLAELKAKKVIIYDRDKVTCNKTGPPLDEIVKRVKYKETFVTISWFIKAKSQLDFIHKNLTNQIMQLWKENESLNNRNQEIENNFQSILQAELLKISNTTSSKQTTLTQSIALLNKSLLTLNQTLRSNNLKNNQNLSSFEAHLKQQIQLLQQTVDSNQQREGEISLLLEEENQSLKKEAAVAAGKIEQIQQLLDQLQRQLSVHFAIGSGAGRVLGKWDVLAAVGVILSLAIVRKFV